MREKYEAMGNEMIRSLGFENKKVILFWKAFEEERWLACELYYNIKKVRYMYSKFQSFFHLLKPF